jgi:hypothetical protein
MESGHIAAIAIASIICTTIAISAVAQAWLSGRSRRDTSGVSDRSAVPTRLAAMEERLYRLEQAIDVVALEVERGTEAQRFTARLLTERLEGMPAARVGAHDES